MKINTIKKIIGVSVLAAIISFAGCSGESGNTPGQGAESEVKETDKNGAVDTSEPVDDKLSKQEDSTESEAGEMPEEAEEEPVDVYNSELEDKHVRLRLEGDGKDVFALWGSGRPDYRYGASLIQNEDGSIDAWFASPGDGKKEYDWLTYRHSEDGGKTWAMKKLFLLLRPGLQICSRYVIRMYSTMKDIIISDTRERLTKTVCAIMYSLQDPRILTGLMKSGTERIGEEILFL